VEPIDVSDYQRINKANWDSRVPHHERGYDLHEFTDDPAHLSRVVQFDLLRLGDIADARAAFEQQLALDEKSDMRGEADAARVDLARTLVGSDPQRAKALVERARRGIDDRGNRAGDRALAADLAIIEMLIESVLLARQHGGDPQSEGPTASPIEGAPRTLPP